MAPLWYLTGFLWSVLCAAASLPPQAVPRENAQPPRTIRSVAEFLEQQSASLSTVPAIPVAPFDHEPLFLRYHQLGSWNPHPAPNPLRLTPLIGLAPNGTPSWLEFSLGMARFYELPSPHSNAPPSRIPDLVSVLNLLTHHRERLRLVEPHRELRLLSLHTDELGISHLRFQQFYEGIPVWAADLYVHIQPSGELTLLNGRYIPTPVGAPTQPRLSPENAIERARNHVWQLTTFTPLPDILFELHPELQPFTASLLLFPHPLTQAVFLCYEVNVAANLVEHYTVFVDALDGSIRWSILNTCTLHVNPWHSSSPCPHHEPPQLLSRSTSSGVLQGTFVNASGTDLNGMQRSFRVYRHDDGMHYMIWDLPSLDRSGSQLPNRVKGGSITLTANYGDVDPQNPRLYHITSPTNTWNDPTAVSAHYNAYVCDSYYRSTHNRNAIDGQGGTIISIIHATYRGQPMDNAYWNGGLKIMVYGDGARDFKPLAGGLDVAAHEMTHGITQHTANLVYQFQPGALNESFSDIFAVMVDREDFLLGEDITRTALALRDLANPSNPNVLSPQPSHMSQYANLPINQDNGGVHINSGIPNRAAYLLIQAIGREKAERIYYRALAHYLTRSSEFIDCRRAVIRAAQELYGSAEAQAAAQAFDGVGIYDGSGGGGRGNEVPPVQGGTWFISFILSDGRIALLRTSDGQSGIISPDNPQTKVLLSPDGFPLSQLSTARSGDRIYFINQQQQLAYADLTRGQFFVVSLPQLSALRNVCISSDGRLASLVTGVLDRSLYITDGQQVARLPLTPQVPDGGPVSTVWLADVMSWSPNMRDPRLAFDALNLLPLQTGDTLAYWNIYEVHFAGPALYELVPPRPEEFSLGNITYSNTDPDLVAFNYVDHRTGIFETLLANFQTGQIAALGTSQWTYRGQPLLDVQRPSFSPDNRYLALVSPRAGLLLVVDLQQGQVGALEAGQPLYHPRWFAMGATGIALSPEGREDVSVQVTAPSEILVRYELPEAGMLWLELLDLMGRPLLVSSPEWHSAGRHERRFSLPGVAPGLYAVRLHFPQHSRLRLFLWLH